MIYFVNFIEGDRSNIGTKESPFVNLSQVPDDSTVVMSNGYNGSINLNSRNNLLIMSNDFYLSLNGDNIPLPNQVQKKNPTLNSPPTTKLSNITLNSCNNVTILNMSVSSSYFVPTKTIPTLTSKGIYLNKCSNCIIQNSELFSERSTVGWTETQWNLNAQGITIVSGNGGNKILNCNTYNCGGIQLKGSGNLVDGNIIRDFPTDGSGIWAYNNIFSNNYIIGSHRVNSNHNDLLQCGPSSGNKILNNTMIAYYSGMSFIDTSVQGIGCFDGYYENFEISGNVIKVDHPIGIWMLGGKKCIIKNNTVSLCGRKAWQKSRSPCILLGNKKSGANSFDCVVSDNKAPHFEFTLNEGCRNNQFNNFSTDLKQIIPTATVMNNVKSI